jgi:hypothetical protein
MGAGRRNRPTLGRFPAAPAAPSGAGARGPSLYRRKFDVAKTLEAFGSPLRVETESDTLTDDVMGLLRNTVQPAQVS